MFKRIVAILPVLFIVSILTFLMIHMLPGDPAVAILGRYADQAQLEALRNEMGLYDSLPIQYINWMRKVLAGDMGRSLITKQPVVEAIQQRIPHTLIWKCMSTPTINGGFCFSNQPVTFQHPAIAGELK
jgi:peptide/nickel transport system permease protein